ncbi:MAG: hypothetical protein ACJAS4_003621 [Bacteriovoracaceae bacterium]|jgi:hypothetical protein
MEVLDLIIGLVISGCVAISILSKKEFIKDLSLYGIVLSVSIQFIVIGNPFLLFLSLITFVVMEFVVKTNHSRYITVSNETKFHLRAIRLLATIVVVLFCSLIYMKYYTVTGIRIENSFKLDQSEKAVTGLIIFLVFTFLTLTKVKPWK